MQLKAMSLGLLAEDYRNDKVPENVHDPEAHLTLRLTAHELQRFSSSGGITLNDSRAACLEINDYVLLKSDDGHTMPARHKGDGEIVRLNLPPMIRAMGGAPIKPRNLEQQYFLDALLDPTLSLVTCYGKAGTGKTILSIAAGLHEVASQHFDGMSITRPVVPMGREIGFLPGDLNEKMSPWLQPYYDALSLVLPAKPQIDPKFAEKKKSKRHGQAFEGDAASISQSVVKPYQRLIDAGVIEIEALTFIRGRSIPNRFFILDEAQQLTPHEVKTVISRMSEGSKLVLIGDPTQIDNPYVDAQSNGLVYARSKLADQQLAAHVKLFRGERSELANLAVKLL
jgi:PhoH-like ATPase